MEYNLPELSYKYNELEPFIDETTMGFHFEKHHAGYTQKLNAAIQQSPELADVRVEDMLKDLNKLPENVRDTIKNNGGGYVNHNLFWSILAPSGVMMSERMKSLLESNFDSIESFKEKFSAAAANRFGSGWAWLCKTDDGNLVINSTPNQDNPISIGLKPILGLDVWEHAYYLKYQNKRPDYIENFYNVINWNKVEALYDSE